MMKIPVAPMRRLLNLLFTPVACRCFALLFFAAMLLLGSIPGKAEAVTAVVHDKALHFAAYALLTALIYGSAAGNRSARAAVSTAAVAVLGAIDEGLQALLSYRNASLVDWQVDLLAAIVVVALLSARGTPRPVSRPDFIK